MVETPELLTTLPTVQNLGTDKNMHTHFWLVGFYSKACKSEKYSLNLMYPKKSSQKTSEMNELKVPKG